MWWLTLPPVMIIGADMVVNAITGWLTLPPVMIIGPDVVNAITCHDYRGLMWWLTLLTVMTVIEIGSQILYFSHFTHL